MAKRAGCQYFLRCSIFTARVVSFNGILAFKALLICRSQAKEYYGSLGEKTDPSRPCGKQTHGSKPNGATTTDVN